MEKRFTEVLAGWIRCRFAQINAQGTASRFEANKQLEKAFQRLLNYPGDQMDSIDFRILRRVEDENDQL